MAVAIAVAALAASAADAEIIAAVNEPVGVGANTCPTQTDIALIDPATGSTFPLPAGVNTPAMELHPSITPDGHWMTFETFDPAGGTTRIRVVDLDTGNQADLFNAFQTAQLQPTSPAITADGTSVITGAPLTATSTGQFAASWNVTSLANFPGGPFANSKRAGNASFPAAGQTVEPDVRPDGALVSGVASTQGGLLLSFPNGLSSVANEGTAQAPALSDPTTNVVVFSLPGPARAGDPGYNDLAFRPVTGFSATASTLLPPVVSAAGTDEFQPAFSPDGRYLGFIRNAHNSDHHDRFFVFDTQTQTLLNSSGIDLGYFSFGCGQAAGPFVRFGGISLRETLTLLHSSVSLLGSSGTGTVSFQLLTPTGVGIFVQRIVGHHRLLGRTVPTLKTVGRVPLGRFAAGKHRVRWSLKVNGHRLRAGRYLVTPRLVTSSGVVTDLGTPRTLRIR